MVELYYVEAVWRWRGQAVRTHFVQTIDSMHAHETARRLVRPRREARVVRVTGCPASGLWHEREVARYRPDA